MEIILSIIIALLVAVCVGLYIYFKLKSGQMTTEEVDALYSSTIADLTKNAIIFIASVASAKINGENKMKRVVNKLLLLVPKSLKEQITADIVQKLAQDVYDGMKEFANNDK